MADTAQRSRLPGAAGTGAAGPGASDPRATHPAPAPGGRLGAVLWPFLAGTLGLFAVMGPVLWSGLGLVTGSRGDPRLVHYTLEHSWRWLAGDPLHASFWDPPIFHPAEGVAAYTDVLVGLGPFYWPWRALGLDAETAFQLWELAAWSTTFAAAWLLLRRSFAFGPAAASLGAYLFAFASFRLANAAHPQLTPQLAVVLGVAAVAGYFGDGASAARRRGWIAAFAAAVAVQAWTAFYPLFFFGLTLVFTLVAALAWPDTRRRLLARLRVDAAWLAAGAGVAAAPVAPLVLRYLETAARLGTRPVSERLMPQPESWLLLGPQSVLYGRLHGPDGITELAGSNHAGGLGIATTLVVLAGLWLARRRPAVRVLVAATAALVVATTWIGDHSPWLLVRELVPGTTAVRAVGRAAMVLLLPASLGLAAATAALRRRWPGRLGTALAVLLLLLVAAEQLQRRAWHDKAHERSHTAALADRIPAGCTSFYMVCTGPRDCRNAPMDAMWGGTYAGLPTVNGRYGNHPEGYRMIHAHGRDRPQRLELRARLAAWERRHGLEPGSVCWVTQRGFNRRRAGTVVWPPP